MRLICAASTCSQCAGGVASNLGGSPSIATAQGDRNNRLATAGAVLAAIEAIGFQCVGDITGDAYGNLPAGVGMAAAVIHCPQGWRKLACIRTMILATEGHDRIFHTVIPAQRVCLINANVRVLGAVNYERFGFSIHPSAAWVGAQGGADFGLLAISAATKGQNRNGKAAFPFLLPPAKAMLVSRSATCRYRACNLKPYCQVSSPGVIDVAAAVSAA